MNGLPRGKAVCDLGHITRTRRLPGSVILCFHCMKAGITTKATVPGTPPPLPHPGRRAWLLERLLAADGPSYDELCAGVVAAFGEVRLKWLASRLGVREVRLLFWDGLATTEPPDGSVWLTPAGWRLLDQMTGS